MCSVIPCNQSFFFFCSNHAVFVNIFSNFGRMGELASLISNSPAAVLSADSTEKQSPSFLLCHGRLQWQLAVRSGASRAVRFQFPAAPLKFVFSFFCLMRNFLHSLAARHLLDFDIFTSSNTCNTPHIFLTSAYLLIPRR